MEESMRLILIAGLVMGVLFIQNTGSASTVIVGPVDITRKIGEDDVVIICPAYGPGAPIWRINGLTYGASSLPASFEAEYENLLILSIESDMNNYSFQCFIVDSNSLNVVGSSIGVLTVDKLAEISEKYYESKLLNYSSLKINHQKLRFNDKSITVSWLYFDGGNIPGCSSVVFRVQGWACKPNSNQSLIDPVWTYDTPDMNITIPLRDLRYKNSSVYVTLEALRSSDKSTVCIDLKFGFQVIKDLSTNIISTSLGQDVCITLPTSGPLVPLTAVWPYTPINQSLGDCHCPLCDGNDCYLYLCNCINDSIYTVSLKSDVSNYQLCFHGITEEMNDTYVHFYNDLIRCDVRSTARRFNSLSPGSYRIYMASYKIILAEPSMPSIHVINKTKKITIDDNKN